MERRRIYQWLCTVVIAISGILLSAYIFQDLRKNDESRVLAELQKETYEQSVRASLLFTRAPQILSSFAAFFTVSDFVSRHEFEQYAASLIKNEPEIAAIMWAPYVPANQRKIYESKLFDETGHGMGFIDISYPEHHPIKAPLREFYLPVIYMTPKNKRANIIGLDVNGRLANQARRIAAMKSGEVFTTPVFSEFTDPHGASMIAIYHPVHLANAVNNKSPGRFLGFLLMLMTPEVLMRSEFGQESQSPFFMRLIDLDDQNNQIAINRVDHQLEPPDHIFSYDFPMPGRHWSLELYSRAPISYDNRALFLCLCLLTLTLIASMAFYRGVNHLIQLKTRTVSLELQRRDLKLKANFDSLTGLHNRRYFQDKMESLLYQQDRDYEIALCLLDLDNFKQINDLLGHAQGDLLLKTVGDVLLLETRSGDLVARLGGDEFALALPLTQGADEIRAVLDRLLKLIPQIGDEVSNQMVDIGASIGIAISSADTCDYEQLMHQADLAMYASKKRGKHTYTFFTPELMSQG